MTQCVCRASDWLGEKSLFRMPANELLGGEGDDRSIVVAVYSPESYSVM